MFVINECINYGVDSVVTFDQPLWLKAMMKKSHNLAITILLGNFHSDEFYRVNWIRNEKFWIEGIVGDCLCENSVKKMLEGKQYEREKSFMFFLG